MKKEYLMSVNDSFLQGFNETITHSYGYVEFKFSFGEGDNKCSVDFLLMVVLCNSIYNCILRIPTIISLYVVTSIINLKMSYHNDNGEVITISGEQGEDKICHKVLQ